MAEPLPLADLLELLRERKLEIGVREHLAVGRLLSRWDDTDVGALRDALAAVLARNPEEVVKVRDAFDELYATAPPAEKHGGSNLSQLPERRRPRPALLAAAAVALALLLGALLWPRPERPAEKPIESRGPTLPPPAGEVRPPKPSIPDVFTRPNRERVLVVAAVIAGGLLFGLYQARLRRATERAARRQWYDELEELADPQGYELELGDAPPPFSSAVLEEAATLLGRRAPTSTRHGELDAERTVERTLRAGLAPQVVFRSRSAPPPILVLEDIGSEMDPWQGRVSALFAGLAARGAPLDRWQFHAGADRVFRSLSDPPVSLRQLARLRGASPLLVVSAGEGVLEGREGKIAGWVEQLAAWPHRAWLHPVGDPGSWRPVLRQPDTLKIPIWPMTAEGILAIARHLGHGRPGAAARATYRTAVDRPVAPLDVDRLRWLLALAPRRDPELLDRLRRRFCPHVPPSAMLEALDAPPLTAPFGLPPEAAPVHVVIADFLAASEPEPGTAAHERWRLDRALQEIRIPGREEKALVEFADLARGPLAGQVGDAVEELTARTSTGPEPPLPQPVARGLRRQVLAPIRRRASRVPLGGWRRLPPPGWVASAAALLVALLSVLALPVISPAFTRDVSVRQDERYLLKLGDASGRRPFQFEVIGNPKWRNLSKDLVGPEKESRRLGALPYSGKLPEYAQEGWYYVRDAAPDENGVLGISNTVWLERESDFSPTPTPTPPPVVLDPTPPGQESGTGGQGSGFGSVEPTPTPRPPIPESGDLWASATARRVRNIFVEQLGIDEQEVLPDASLIDDLGADELDITQLVMAFEEEFGIEVARADAERLSTVGDWVRYLENTADPNMVLDQSGRLSELAGLFKQLEAEVQNTYGEYPNLDRAVAQLRREISADNVDLDSLEAGIRNLEELVRAVRPTGEQRGQGGAPTPPPPAPTERITINFTPASSRLLGISMAKLDEVSLRMRQDPEVSARITAHIYENENRNPEGLAQSRAEAVKNYLVERHGIDPARIQILTTIDRLDKRPPEDSDRIAIVELTFP